MVCEDRYGNQYMFTRRILPIWILLAVMAATAGPFGTYGSTTFAARLAYWTMVVVSSSLIGRAVHTVVKSYIHEVSPWLTHFISTVVITAVYTPILWFVTYHLFMMRDLENAPTFSRLLLYVAVITFAVLAFRSLVPGLEKLNYLGTLDDLEPGSPAALPRLQRRLPDDFEGPILRLTVRDHFVDVVSEKATHSIRMRFTDAIDEMDTVAGYCTHRSHWVVEDAIAGVERGGGKILLRLTNGDRVPVSRKYRPDLETAGIV